MDLDFIKDVVTKDQQEQCIVDVVSVIVEPSGGPSEGYTSNVNRAKLKVKLGNGKLEEKSFIIKSNPTGPLTRKLLHKYQLTEKERSVYEQLIPGLERVMKERGDTKENMWCRFIDYRENLIILEDLKIDGYRTVPVMECLDYDHIILALCTLGRFHAISKVFFKTDVDEETIQKFRKYPMFGDSVMLDMFNTGGLITLSQVMKESWGPEWCDIADRIYTASMNNEEYFKSLFQNRKEEMDVLNHGDLWCCNIMFQYHDFKNIPVRARFVDFQLTHFNSLAWDLTFLIYSSVRTSLRRKSLQDMLDAYFNTFSETLEYYGYEGPRPTRKSFDEEMDRYKYMGLTVLCTCYTITATSENTFTMKPLLQKNGPRLCYLPFIYNIPRYKSDVQEDLLNFANDGIF